jgi:phosphate/sulfate permease
MSIIPFLLVLSSVPALFATLLLSSAFCWNNKSRKGWPFLLAIIFSGTVTATTIGIAVPLALAGEGLDSYSGAIILLLTIPITSFVSALILVPKLYKQVNNAQEKKVVAVIVSVPVLVFIFLSTTPNYKREPSFSLHGKIVNYRNNEPLSGVTVAVFGLYAGGFMIEGARRHEYVTDSNGEFHVDGYAKKASIQPGDMNYFILYGQNENDYHIQRNRSGCDFEVMKIKSGKGGWMTGNYAEQYTRENPLIFSACEIVRGPLRGIFGNRL